MHFTCLPSGAVYLELDESLSTDAFWGAFFRFLFARGFFVTCVSPNNGTNFHGAVTKLSGCKDKTIDQGRVLRQITCLVIRWHFIAPAASHAGGVLERLILNVCEILTAWSVDRRLFRVPSDYDLWTNFKHLEAILNSHTLIPVSADPDDVRVLTPMGLLNGCIDAPLSPGSLAHCDGLRTSWKASQLFADEFWHRWL